MRPVLRHAVVAVACGAALVLAGCGKHVASNAPITFAPADTPYLFANFTNAPAEAVQAWAPVYRTGQPAQIRNLSRIADVLSDKDPRVAAVLNAVHDELANVHTAAELTKATGLSWPAMYALYGIGDVPVARTQLASAGTFKAFWARVEKRAGVTAPTATLGKQAYWVIGAADDKLHFLVAIEGDQLVMTVAPADASPDVLRQLLGLTKPSENAADRLSDINSRQGYNDYGSGYVDVPRLFANLFDSKNAVTQALAKNLGVGDVTGNPACASEFASLAKQVPLVTGGMRTYTAQEASGSLDVQLSPELLGALTALKQPVPGMDAKPGDSMFDMVMALPLRKWQAFIKGRAEAAAAKGYQCPALQSLDNFAKNATNPPVQMPPEAASLLGFRVTLDKWDIGPQIAGRALVASSNPAELAQKIQQTMPQFALKTIPTDGKPVAFDLPPRLQAMLGGNNRQGWIAANSNALAVGLGDGEDARLGGTLTAAAGNGDKLLRLHLDGKMYQLLGSWMGRISAMMPAERQADLQQQIVTFNELGKIVRSEDIDVKLDDKGLHFNAEVTHR